MRGFSVLTSIEMGLVLWGVALHRGRLALSDFCQIAGCTPKVSMFCEIHCDPVQLPMRENDAPQHIRDIISACRADISLRPTASDLLQMFPAEPRGPLSFEPDHQSHPSGGRQLPQQVSTPENLSLWGVQTSCSICEERMTANKYHCDACHRGDFDVCVDCFKKGFHCSGPNHYLRDQSSVSEEAIYYSSLLESGERDIVVLT